MRSSIAIVLVATLLVLVSVPARAGEVPGTACTVFPASNIWNTRVDTLPVHEISETWLASADAGSTDLHPDFGSPSYELPFDVVGRRHSRVRIDFQYAEESDRGPYPFDARTPIEGGSDRHALIVERGTCRLYELFAAEWNGGDPQAGSGAIFDLDSNLLRPQTWTSADAAGLPIFAGLVRWDEVKAGSIRHAIRFSPRARTILRAMQRYGLMLADNGSNWYFQGTRDGHWTNNLLDQLKTVPASAFEAVDVSGCIVDVDSGEADCK
ncbi:MAG: hypothetical protein L0206_10775 [Actinobacteria bacterium]|nr:hypothetical protein [Actinomycetota bacterium]